MIITGFDGKNVAVSFDGLEFKSLMHLVKNADEAALKLSSYELGKFGFALSPTDIQTYRDSSQLISKDVLDIINRAGTPNEKEPAQDDRYVM